MTTDVNYYRCPTCGAIVAAQDLGTPWAGVGWDKIIDELVLEVWVTHRHPGQRLEAAEPLSELPREAVLS